MDSSPEPSQNQQWTPAQSSTPHSFQPATANSREEDGRKKTSNPVAQIQSEYRVGDYQLRPCPLATRTEGICRKKLEKMGAIIYSYEAEKFGVKTQMQQKGPATQPKSRRQCEIDRLVKKRRQLRKQWRKVTEMERVGLDALQAEIK